MTLQYRIQRERVQKDDSKDRFSEQFAVSQGIRSCHFPQNPKYHKAVDDLSRHLSHREFAP